MSTDVAVYLQDAHTIRQGMEIAQYAESKGFHAIWQAESRLVREATVPMSAFLAVTERIKVGSGVVNNWTRNPALLASTFSTLDDLAPGRVILGIGAWWDPLASKVGIQPHKPLLAMRETIEAVRALLADENVTYDGEFVHLDGVELDYVHQERRAEGRPHLPRRHRHADDGARRRDRRRGRAQLPRLAQLQRHGHGSSRAGRKQGGPLGHRPRPPAARRLLARRGPRRRPRRRPVARDPVPRPAAPHHEGLGRPRVAPRGDRQGAHLAGDGRARSRRPPSSCPTTSCR